MKWQRNIRPPKDFCVRILLLSFFIFIVNCWSIHHMGSQWTSSFIANGPILIIGIYGLFSKPLTKSLRFSMRSKIHSWFFIFLKTPVLIILFGIFLVAGSLVSSVTIISGDIQNINILSLAPEGTTAQCQSIEMSKNPNDVRHFIKFTTPFGRPYYLKMKGFQRYSFDLYPWIGTRIRVSRDLEVSPSILVRVPGDSIGMLERGEIVVTTGKKIIAQIKTKKYKGALLIGDYPGVSNALLTKWKTELIAMSFNETSRARSLLAWQYPLSVQPEMELYPGLPLMAKFIVNDKIMARAKFKVGIEKIQDIILFSIDSKTKTMQEHDQ